MKHKHADLIHAWADGAEIEYRCKGSESGTWYAEHDPKWDATVFEYRIKPTPKPDVVRDVCADRAATLDFHTDEYHRKNLRLTFDGETGKLKSAEVL